MVSLYYINFNFFYFINSSIFYIFREQPFEMLSVLNFWFLNHQLFWIFSYSFFLHEIFFFVLLFSLFLCILLIFIRLNFFNNMRWTYFYSIFPVQKISLLYNCFLFFVSLFVLWFSLDNDIIQMQHYQKIINHFLVTPSSPILENPDVWFLELRPLWSDHNVLYYSALTYVYFYSSYGIRLSLWEFWNFIYQPFILLSPNCAPKVFSNSVLESYLFFHLRFHAIWLFFDKLVGLENFFYYNFVSDMINFFFRNADAFVFSFDGLSMIFIVLTIFITTLCFIVSWYSYHRDFVYTITLLLFISQFFVIFVFSTLDLIFFYLAFESVLIPLFFLVGIFGSRERRIKAAYYLMFYTLIGSLPLLLGILYLWYKTGQTNILLLEPFLLGMFDQTELNLLWFLFLPGFAFKIPLYPFHLWLPEAHVEAPTIGSVILAGLVLKLGGYGFIRFSIGLFYWGGVSYLNFVYWLCLFSMLASMMCAACQIDMKRIIAYGSVSHMGLVTLCIFLGTQVGLESAMIMMLGHGFVSSALFILVGGLYERFHSRNVRYYGGLYKILPVYGTFFFLFTLFDIGVPGSPSFVAELLAFVGVVQESLFIAILMILPVVLGAGVGLLVCSRVLFGLNESRNYLTFQTIILNFVYWVSLNENILKISNISPFVLNSCSRFEYLVKESHDFLKHEMFVLFVLFLSALSLGLYPQMYLKFFIFSLENILQITIF